MKKVDYFKYEARLDDMGLVAVYEFCLDGVWDENVYAYSEAVEAYPLGEYEWVEC